jgi:hypothetical protein
MPVQHRHSAVAIASGLIGPLGGGLLLLGIMVALAWSWWAGGILAAVAVLSTGNSRVRGFCTYALAAAVHSLRGERKAAPRPAH